MSQCFRVIAVASLWVALGLISCQAYAQQATDRSFVPLVITPAYAMAQGPTVCLDEGHNNFHTLAHRFWPFGELLRADGYVLRSLSGRFALSSLASCKVLVIANAQPGDENWDAYPYPTPPAFTNDEASLLKGWVDSGGSLLLIADHMPFPGAASNVAAAFGFAFNDGFAVENFSTEAEGRAAFDKPTVFVREDGTLREHPITRGNQASEAISRIRSFTGQAFLAPAGAEPLMVLPKNFISLMPEKAWRFTMQTRRVPVGGWLQGAVMEVGKGRLAVFGEAGMFTAQVQGPERIPMGMNAPLAEQNYRFTLNLIRWLIDRPKYKNP